MIERSIRCLGPHGFHRIVYREWPGPFGAPVQSSVRTPNRFAAAQPPWASIEGKLTSTPT
jgi:hypothetical protein